MPELIRLVILAIIQGITEFLPVSSSGHLVIIKGLFGLDSPGVGLEVALHAGTLISIIFYYFSDIAGLAKPFFVRGYPGKSDSTRIIGLILLATIPVLIVGLLFKGLFEGLYSNGRLTSGMLLVTGAIIASSALISRRNKRFDVPAALGVGIAQAIAIMPGISRSGVTIVIARVFGIEPEEAARFSFILAIPAILGAVVLEIAGNLHDFRLEYLIGMAVSALTGYISLKLLIRALRGGKLWIFAPYCFLAGAIGLIFL